MTTIMSSRIQNAGLVALLVALLVVVASALRTPEPVVAAPRTSSSTASSAATSSESPVVSPSASASSTSPVIPSGASVAFLGDSFAAGTGASTAAKRWSLVAGAQGWSETNAAHAQTGYTKAGAVADCTPTTCPAHPNVVAEVVAAKPALVVITGGANELSQDKAAVSSAVTKTINDIRAGAPEAKIIVVNPWWDLRPVSPNLADYSSAIQAATTGTGAQWLDTGQPLVGQGQLLQSDGVQANDAGHAALTAAVTSGLTSAGLIAP